MEVYPHEDDKVYALALNVDCQHLGWKVSLTAQFSNAGHYELSQFFSEVEYQERSWSSEGYYEADGTECRKHLGLFIETAVALLFRRTAACQ